MNKKMRKGFTLTELIIVIVIIGILAAVLIPTLTQYIGRSQQSADEEEARSELTEIINDAILTKNMEYVNEVQGKVYMIGDRTKKVLCFENGALKETLDAGDTAGATAKDYHSLTRTAAPTTGTPKYTYLVVVNGKNAYVNTTTDKVCTDAGMTLDFPKTA